MNELHLFAGAGGGILGGMLLGHTCVCAVEIEPYPRKVLLQRQRDGILPKFPIWDDVRTFDGTPWRGQVDIVCGGFPCQDISSAGKGAGISGERSGLWSEMARIIREVQPAYALVENSPMLTGRGLGNILGDLAAMGYDARWGVLGAVDAGAPHERERMWIVANSSSNHGGSRGSESTGQQRKTGIADGIKITSNIDGIGRDRRSGTREEQTGRGKPADFASDADLSGCKKQREHITTEKGHAAIKRTDWWAAEPGLVRMVYGMAHRVDRIKSLGNGQIPAVVELAWKILTQEMNDAAL